MIKNSKANYYLFALGNTVVKEQNGLFSARDKQAHQWIRQSSWFARLYDAAYDVVAIEYDEKTETILSQWPCF